MASEEDEMALRHHMKHTWRPVNSQHFQQLLQEYPQMGDVLTGGVTVYWELFLNGVMPAWVVLTAIDLLQRALLADAGAAPLTPCLPAACLWIACKVVEGQDCKFTWGEDFRRMWNESCDDAKLHVTLTRLLDADAHVLVQLEFRVTYATSYDLVKLVLRNSSLDRTVHVRISVRVVEALMVLEGGPEMLRWRPSEVASALCRCARVSVPDYFPEVHPELAQAVHDAWTESFED
jgi:hypothetical protein